MHIKKCFDKTNKRRKRVYQGFKAESLGGQGHEHMNHEPSSSIFIRSRPRMGMCLCVCELALASRCLVASAPMSLTAARGEGKGGVDPLCRFKTPRVRISCPLTRSILGGTARTSQSRWRPLTLHAEKNINFRFAAIVSICD